MEIDTFGRIVNIAETALGVGQALHTGFNYLRDRQQLKRAREEFEQPKDSKRSKTTARPRYMAYGRRSFKPTRSRRRYARKRTVPRSPYYRRVVRSSGMFPISLLATQSQFITKVNIGINGCETSDLQQVYSLYRLVKVVMRLVPRVDPANSGLSNNWQAVVAAASDPEDQATPTSITGVTAYDNSRQAFVNSGQVFKYTFYPKAANSVDINGTATAIGSYGRMNPWLRLNATGITVPHYNLIIGVTTGTATTTTLNFDYILDYHFDVHGLS